MKNLSDERPYLSVLVPVFNEEDNVATLGAELAAVLGSLGMTWEVLLIDDGSTDGSFDAIERLARTRDGFKALRLTRNVGQTAALAAGIDHCGGELIACLDADLQNDPRDLPQLLDKLSEGYDVVSGWRRRRQDAWLTRRLPSRAANWLISRVTGVALHDYGCTLKVYRARYLRPLRLHGEMHRFLPAFAAFLGARIAELPVHHRPRRHGRSKYGLTRTFKVALDLLTVKFMDRYIGKPIYFFGGWGLAIGGCGAALALATLYNKLRLGIYVKDQPLFLVSIFLALVGFQLVLLGLLAEISVRAYFDIKERPAYFVREAIGLETRVAA